MQLKQLLYLLVFFAFKGLHSQNDTLNLIDSTGKKQGHWTLLGKHKPGTCYLLNQIIETGFYSDNKKNGVWKEYFCNGNLKNIITFINGKPNGPATLYYENGKINEKGLFTNNRWIGRYDLYFDNGNIQHEFYFNEKGKREGKQLAYYEDGKLHYECYFKNGIEIIDSCLVYAKDGEFVDYKNRTDIYFYDDGIKTYKKKSYPIYNDNIQLDNFNNGKQTLYNSKRQIVKDVIFKDNKFIEGKEFFYDADGNLILIKYYKDGVYIDDTNKIYFYDDTYKFNDSILKKLKR